MVATDTYELQRCCNVMAATAKASTECLNGEIFCSLKEAQIVIEDWRVEYNTKRPHSALGYRPPAPAACSPWRANPSSQPMSVILKSSHFLWTNKSGNA